MITNMHICVTYARNEKTSEFSNISLYHRMQNMD